MKLTNDKRLVAISVIISLIVTGCFDDYSSEHWDHDVTTSLTAKETQFRKKLEGRGFSHIQIFVPLPGRIPSGQTSYVLRFKTGFYINNQEALNHVIGLRKQLANELYSTVIEDSIIFDLKEIDVYQKDSIAKGFDVSGHGYFDSFLKDSLEKWNGFKVIRTGKMSYERIEISK